MEVENIEKFFLNTILKIAIAGLLIVLVSDIIISPGDTLSPIIDSVLLGACITAYLLRNVHQTSSVLIVTSIALLAMLYQSLTVAINTTTSFSILLVVGFVFSVMLKKGLMWFMHGITFLSINGILVYQMFHPNLSGLNNIDDIITISIAYSILYIILTYAAAKLKLGYDQINHNMSIANIELKEKADKIEKQNKELVKVHDKLNDLNKGLERIVNDRTRALRERTEKLEKYSFSNAHHLRGPIARLLGLITLRKMEKRPDTNFFFNEMENQVNEIDSVVKQINRDLEESDITNQNGN